MEKWQKNGKNSRTVPKLYTDQSMKDSIDTLFVEKSIILTVVRL